MVEHDKEIVMIAVVRWVSTEVMEQGDEWKSWLRDELREVVAREPGSIDVPSNEIVIREATVGEHPHAESLRPSKPARLFIAEVPHLPEQD